MALVHEGDLVRIRPLEERDLVTIQAWRVDSNALGGFNAPTLRPLEPMKKLLAETGLIEPDHGRLAIETLDQGRLIGHVGYSKDNPVYTTAARTFIVIGRAEDRTRGYGSEAHRLLVNYLFLSTDLERIYSETEEENLPTRRLFEKCGMSLEGVARHLFFDLGRWMNMAVYSIIRPEWESSPMYETLRKPFVEPWFKA